MKSLIFKKDPCIVLDSPDRPNIKISCHLISNSATLEETFQWLIEALREKKENLDKHLVFCKTINDCARIYRIFIKIFSRECELFNMFHSKTPDSVKEFIRQDMSFSAGIIRVLICTNAAGMGVNFKDLHNVIHYGPPNDLDTFLQQMGRAGRDGRQAHEIVIYRLHKGHLKAVDAEIVQMLRSDKCRRKIINAAYMSTSESTCPVSHACCDNCEQSCDCGDSLCPMSHPIKEMYVPESEEEEEKLRTVSLEHEQLLESKLLALQCQLEIKEQVSVVPNELMHGFTTAVIQQVLANASTIFSTEDVMRKASVWSHEVAKMIINIIETVFCDTDTMESSDDEN